jgi:hypothetical protein
MRNYFHNTAIDLSNDATEKHHMASNMQHQTHKLSYSIEWVLR